MAVLTSAPCVIYLISMWISPSAEETKTVKPGDNVTLHCQSPRDEAITLLAWSRPDLKTDDYVFFFRENRSYEHYQHPSFRGRVQLRDPEMKDGNVSVILKNVTINDTGTYECRVSVNSKEKKRKRATPELMNTINLTVSDSGHTAGNTWTEGHKDEGNLGLTVGLSVAAVLLLLAIVVGFVMHRQHRQRPDQHVHYRAGVP